MKVFEKVLVLCPIVGHALSGCMMQQKFRGLCILRLVEMKVKFTVCTSVWSAHNSSVI